MTRVRALTLGGAFASTALATTILGPSAGAATAPPSSLDRGQVERAHQDAAMQRLATEEGSSSWWCSVAPKWCGRSDVPGGVQAKPDMEGRSGASRGISSDTESEAPASAAPPAPAPAAEPAPVPEKKE